MRKTTDITIILDRSGSMETIKSATIEGFNSFLRDQKKNELQSFITFVQFDDCYEMVYEEKNIENVQYLNRETFVPRGLTALLDAIGTTISSTKKRIKLLPKSKRPEDILIAIITDGMENASRKYTQDEIFRKIKSLEEEHGWKFVFIAANQDAIHEGLKYGIPKERALSFISNGDGMKEAMQSFSRAFYEMKNKKNKMFEFIEEDREKQKR